MLQNIDKRTISTFLVVILLVVLAFWFSIESAKHKNDYSVVYLTTGDVYIGKLTTFPDFELTNAYLFQVTKSATDPTQNAFQLNPINQSLWAPTVLHLETKNIIFYGPLSPTSKIAETIAGQGE